VDCGPQQDGRTGRGRFHLAGGGGRRRRDRGLPGPVRASLGARVRAGLRKETKEKATIKAIADGGLTAAAGIVYVKPHHPFSVAGGLAGELTASAKRWKRAAGREVSSLDLHVAFESTLT